MSKRRATFQVVWLGIGFSLIFVAFNVAVSMVTTLYPTQGFNILAVIYASFTFGSMGASYLTPRVDVRILFVLSGAAYAIFIAALTWGAVATFITAALVGISAGILFIHQGALITVQAAASAIPIGRLTAIFLVLFVSTTVAGNLVSVALLRTGVSRSTILTILAVTASIGAAWLAFLRPPNNGIVATSKADTDPSLSAKMRAMVSVARAPPMAAVLPLILWNGAVTTLAYANVPTFIPPSMLATHPETLPIMFVAFGAASALTTPAVGQAYDAWGLAPLVWACTMAGTLADASAYAAILAVPHITAKDGAALAVLVAAETFLGVMIAGTNCLINVTLSAWNPDGTKVAAAFSAYGVVFCAGYVPLALVSNAVAWQAVMALNHGLMVAAVGSLASHITFGKHVYFQCYAKILDVCPIKIGDRAIFGPGVSLFTAEHALAPTARDGVFGAIWTTVGAGSVVTRNVPSMSVAVGNPARVVRKIVEDENWTPEQAWDKGVDPKLIGMKRLERPE
ncbi:putative O-acetyl transferase [Allomyces javanicus]|nr:putative O-acetyl transferase [Allomyces javanicus]